MDLVIEKFKTPPIREAVFIINFSKSISFEKIKQLVNEDLIIKKYPIYQVAIQNNLKVDAKGNAPSTSLQRLQEGLIFRTSKDLPEWVLQVKKNNVLLHKINNYSTWENLIQELETILQVLGKIFRSETQIKDIGIRYINHIPIDKNVELRDWFKFLPEPIANVNTNFNKFLLQSDIEKDGMTGLIIESIININSIANFVIDIRVSKQLNNVEIGYDFIESDLRQIRDFKNQVFFSIITDNLKNKFR